MRVTCNQNRIHGCAHVSDLPSETYTLPGTTRRREHAAGRCEACNLPLSVFRNA